MSLKRLKRRLSQTFRGSRGVDESLSELAESLTIEENGGIKENGEYMLFSPTCLDYVKLKQLMESAKKIPVSENLENLEQDFRRGISNILFEMITFVSAMKVVPVTLDDLLCWNSMRAKNTRAPQGLTVQKLERS